MRDAKGRFIKAVTHPMFKIGDRVEIFEGVFKGGTGTITEIDGSDIPFYIELDKRLKGRSYDGVWDDEECIRKIYKDENSNIEPPSIYLRAVKHFGEQAQIHQATEELAELIVALSHHRRSRVVNSFVCSEIAHVEIMCAQLREIFGSDAVDVEKAEKIARLAKELEK